MSKLVQFKCHNKTLLHNHYSKCFGILQNKLKKLKLDITYKDFTLLYKIYIYRHVDTYCSMINFSNILELIDNTLYLNNKTLLNYLLDILFDKYPTKINSLSNSLLLCKLKDTKCNVFKNKFTKHNYDKLKILEIKIINNIDSKKLKEIEKYYIFCVDYVHFSYCNNCKLVFSYKIYYKYEQNINDYVIKHYNLYYLEDNTSYKFTTESDKLCCPKCKNIIL